jgi:hypothetical protein
VAVTPDAFIFPRGKLRPVMLGVSDAEQLGEALAPIIADARAKASGATDVDEAVTQYVYWQAYERILLLRATEPTAQSVPSEWSESYGGRQLLSIQQMAIDAKARFDALIPPPVGRTVAAGGTAVRTEITW